MMNTKTSINEPIRILHMIGSFEVGGSQALVINLYKAIDRSKIQFDFIVDHPERMELATVVQELGARIFFMPTFVGGNILQVKKAWNTFFKEHPEYKILHSHVRSYASIYLPIAKKYGLKTIIHSHSTSNGTGVSAIVKKCLQIPLRYQADYLFSCSAEAGEWLFGKKACSKKNYVFLPNAIKISDYQFSEETAKKYRKELGLDGKFVVGHVGRFHEAKNHLFLLDVFAEVCKHRSDAMLLLVGDGELRTATADKVKELGLTERVIFTGNRKDVPQLLQTMDVFVFPSVWEGLPVTVIEAQAAGLPCIISDSITQEVDVSDLVKRLSISNIEKWVNVILKTKNMHLDVSSQIIQAGFEAKSVVAFLEAFYCLLF